MLCVVQMHLPRLKAVAPATFAPETFQQDDVVIFHRCSANRRIRRVHCRLQPCFVSSGRERFCCSVLQGLFSHNQLAKSPHQSPSLLGWEVHERGVEPACQVRGVSGYFSIPGKQGLNAYPGSYSELRGFQRRARITLCMQDGGAVQCDG